MNQKRLIAISIVLLIFNSISALWGGIGLIFDPSGDLMQMPLSFLHYTPFTNFLIPGIILLTANGLLSIVVSIITIKRVKHYPYWIIAQGVVLAVWLSVQIIMLRVFFPPLHLPYYLTAMGLIISGGLLTRTREV
jgi:hypothetical protein